MVIDFCKDGNALLHGNVVSLFFACGRTRFYAVAVIYAKRCNLLPKAPKPSFLKKILNINFFSFIYKILKSPYRLKRVLNRIVMTSGFDGPSMKKSDGDTAVNS